MERHSPPTVMGKLMAAFSPIRLKKTNKPKLRNWQQTRDIGKHSGLQRTNSERQHTPTRPASLSSSRSLKRAQSETLAVRRNSYSPKTQSLMNQARSSSPVPCSPVLRPAGHGELDKIPPLQDPLQRTRISIPEKTSGYMKSRDNEPTSPAYDKKEKCQNCSRWFWASEARSEQVEVNLTRSGQLSELHLHIDINGENAKQKEREALRSASTGVSQVSDRQGKIGSGSAGLRPGLGGLGAALAAAGPAATAPASNQQVEFCSKECMWSYSMRMSDST